MKINDKLLDEQIKKAAVDYKNNIIVPDPTNWERVNAEIKKHKQKSRRLRTIKQLSSIAAAAIVISVVIANNNGTVTASFSKFLKQFKNEVTYIFVNKANKDAGVSLKLAHDNKNSPLFNDSSIQEALKTLDFTPKLPTYLPDGFVIDEISNLTNENKESSFKLIVSVPNAEQIIYINYKLINDNISTIRESELMNTSEPYEEIQVGNYNAVVIGNEQRTSINWVSDSNVTVSITSNIDKLELSRIAKSME